MIGRDAKINMIDLWMEKPDNVAEIRVGLEAAPWRPANSRGYEDKFAIAGSYWPPQYTIMKGDDARAAEDRGDARHDRRQAGVPPEPRVASIVSPPLQARVRRQRQGDRADAAGGLLNLNALKVTTIGTARFPHDGGLDSDQKGAIHGGRQPVNKIAAVDLKEASWRADRRGQDPHPGRGANFVHPEVRPGLEHRPPGRRDHPLIGTDPVKNKANAFKVVGNVLKGQGGGNLFPEDAPEVAASVRGHAAEPRSEAVAIGGGVRHQERSTRAHRAADRRVGQPVDDGAKRVVQPEYNKAGDGVVLGLVGQEQTERAGGGGRQDAQAQAVTGIPA